MEAASSSKLVGASVVPRASLFRVRRRFRTVFGVPEPSRSW